MADMAQRPNLSKEIALHKQGYFFVAGVDEAGRGAWAGPVVAAAVILPPQQPNLLADLAGLNDSKKLSAAQREAWFARLPRVALATGVGSCSAAQVDALNVLQATRQAMQAAIAQLDPPPDYLLLDHVTLPTLKTPQDSFPKADSISLSVAAASVLAKVTRDRLMVQLSTEYPHYQFERHKGYGTAVHRAALAEYGPCPHHRLSYKPLHNFSPSLFER